MLIFICFRFIFVNYNAWLYSSSDELCGGIVACLDEKIEDEFGAFVTRTFRTLSLDLVEKSTSNFTSLLIQFENNQPNENELDEIKKKLSKTLGENLKFSKLQDWEIRNNCIVDISNKEKCWVIKCYGQKRAKEAHNRLQSCRDIKVSFLETSASLQTANSVLEFWKHIKNYPRMNFIFALSIWFLLLLVIIGLLIYIFIRVRILFLSSLSKSNIFIFRFGLKYCRIGKCKIEILHE